MIRYTLTLSLACCALLLGVSASAAQSPDHSLIDVARDLQQRPYTPNKTPLAAPFANLNYNAFRGIRTIVGKSSMLKHGDNFAIDMLPPGLYYPDPVRIDQVTSDGLREIEFSPSLFDFDEQYFDDIPESSPGAGFSGLRLRYPLNTTEHLDEVLVMQGASYFRAVGQAMAYGMSARAIAIGTGSTAGEEFPRFIHLRLHSTAADLLHIEGVIDSPSLTAHLAITLRPGKNTEMKLVTSLFPRVTITDIGIAPLTSMYLKGPMLSAVSDDFRPRVHDSDVLWIENGKGEHLWRPIANPRLVETSAFVDTSPKRFGLYQTAREFESFQDTEARYHDRPSVLVEPLEPWGDGAIMLVEIPTANEFLDNTVVFWRPNQALTPAQEYQYSYRLTWTREAPDLGGLPPIVQGRSGREHDKPGHRRFVIDVATQEHTAAPLVSVTEGAEILGVSAFAMPGQQSTRITFLLAPADLDSVDIRLSLRKEDGTPLSPVWLHRWTRHRDGGV